MKNNNTSRILKKETKLKTQVRKENLKLLQPRYGKGERYLSCDLTLLLPSSTPACRAICVSRHSFLPVSSACLHAPRPDRHSPGRQKKTTKTNQQINHCSRQTQKTKAFACKAFRVVPEEIFALVAPSLFSARFASLRAPRNFK